MHRYTAQIILRTDKPRKDGTCPLALQVSVNGKRKKIHIDMKCRPEQFDHVTGLLRVTAYPKEIRSEIHDHNIYIQSCIAKTNSIFVDHRLNDHSLTVDRFIELYRSKTSHLVFTDFYEKEIVHLDPMRSWGTILSYNNTLKKLKAFKEQIMFHELTYEFIANFDRWLRTKEKQDVNSCWKHHRNIKFFINQAMKKGVKIESPYRTFKAKTAHSDRPFLTHDEVIRLQELYDEPLLSSNLRRSLRAFLFACWTGLRISDVYNITEDMIIEDTLVFVPVKTSMLRKVVRVPLSETAKKFMRRASGNLFTKVSEKQVNQDLKEIARLAGIQKKLTFHVGRHTFAMMFLEAGNQVEVLQQILGHAKIETTMIYVHIRGEQRKASMARMDEYAKRKTVAK